MEKKIESLHDGKVVIVKPTNQTIIVPLFCDLCSYPMKSIEDSISYRKIGICSHCDLRWTGDKRIDWSSKKYPDKDWEEWKEYIEIRAITACSSVRFY
jgi:hypothetical protein